MKNFVSNGLSKQFIAPSGGVVGGQVYGVNGIIGVVVADAAETEQFTLKQKGEYSDVQKATGEVWTIGDKLYYNAVTGDLTISPTYTVDLVVTNLFFAGFASEAALNTAVLGSIRLV